MGGVDVAGVLRPRRLLIAALLVLPLLLAGGPAAAAPAGPAPAAVSPASDAEITLYSRMAAMNACIARAAGVEFDKAVAIAGETIAQLIQGQHGGAIAQVSAQPLNSDELRKGSINAAVLGAAELCPSEVPADVIKRVQDALKQAGPAAKPASP